MTALIENAYELETIAASARAEGEIGAIFLKGHLRYPSKTGGWQLGDLDLDEYLAKLRDRKLVLIVASISEVEPATMACGICGFVMNEAGECASPLATVRCKLEIAERARDIVDTGEDRDVVDQVADLLDEHLDGDA